MWKERGGGEQKRFLGQVGLGRGDWRPNKGHRFCEVYSGSSLRVLSRIRKEPRLFFKSTLCRGGECLGKSGAACAPV